MYFNHNTCRCPFRLVITLRDMNQTLMMKGTPMTKLSPLQGTHEELMNVCIFKCILHSVIITAFVASGKPPILTSQNILTWLRYFEAHSEAMCSQWATRFLDYFFPGDSHVASQFTVVLSEIIIKVKFRSLPIMLNSWL